MKIIAASDLRRGYGDNSHINFVIGRAGMMANINNCDRKYSGLITPPVSKGRGQFFQTGGLPTKNTRVIFRGRGGIKRGMIGK